MLVYAIKKELSAKLASIYPGVFDRVREEARVELDRDIHTYREWFAPDGTWHLRLSTKWMSQEWMVKWAAQLEDSGGDVLEARSY